MTIRGEDLLDSILESLDRISNISVSDLPNIDLYMDQVTTFMGGALKASARYPDTDKILTKTMINNYTKNRLLPPPIRKKYSREHLLILIFIYYFKGVMSIGDIQTLLGPITEKYFGKKAGFTLAQVYEEVFSLEPAEVERMKEDIRRAYQASHETFQDASEKDAEFLRMFSFVCMLSFDVYVKRLLIEKLIDKMRGGEDASGMKRKKP